MKTAVIVAGLVLAAPAACLAANANQPYANVDHRVDAGNNTGDAQVDRLNQAQLSQPGQLPSYAGTIPPRPYAGGAPPRQAAAAPNYAAPYPPPAYATPIYAAPVYAPPPYPYAYYPPPYVVVPRRYVRPYFYPY